MAETKNSPFSAEERAAMKEHVAEVRRSKKGATWASDGEARFIAQPQVQIAAEGRSRSAITTGRPSVAVYVDLLPQRSDTAFVRYIEAHEPFLAGWLHLTSASGTLLDPTYAGLIAADVAAHIRALSNGNSNAEVHLLLRCPFPLALLIGRLPPCRTCGSPPASRPRRAGPTKASRSLPSAKRPGVRPNSSAPASSRSSSTREPQPSRPTGPS